MKSIPLQEISTFFGQNLHVSLSVNGFCIDSRKIKSGDLFFALPGNQVDGHAFLYEVQQKGACAAIVKNDFSDPLITIPLIKVKDVLEALQSYARDVLKKRKTKVIAITGSIGKTTTKDFLFQILQDQFHVFANPASYNSQITLPLSILLAEGTEDFLILEMGMTHSGQIEKLVSIAPPDISLITNIAVQHACNFSDGLTGISREKSKVFTHPLTKAGIVPFECFDFEKIMQVGPCSKITFSIKNAKADFFLESKESRIVIYEQGIPHEIHFKLPVKELNQNLLAAAVVARILGLTWESIANSIPNLKLPQMRFEEIKLKGITIINDAYNANPDSMKAALESLPKPMPGGKTIAVLSEMTELGAYSKQGHAFVGETALRHVDYLLCIGAQCEEMQKIWIREKKSMELFNNRVELEKKLIEIVNPGDVVLLKGARFWALEKILEIFKNES